MVQMHEQARLTLIITAVNIKNNIKLFYWALACVCCLRKHSVRTANHIFIRVPPHKGPKLNKTQNKNTLHNKKCMCVYIYIDMYKSCSEVS